jgi:hypothetical protein
MKKPFPTEARKVFISFIPCILHTVPASAYNLQENTDNSE